MVKPLTEYFEKKKIPLTVFLASVLFILICLSAWIGDDAFIGLRSIKHFIQGDGWRYNVSERVQTFTNPLLQLCLMIAVFVTKEYYNTLLCLNLAATAGALYLFFFRQEKSVGNLVFCSVLMIAGAAFKDYATSGLENSFGYFISALFFLKLFSRRTFGDKDVFFLSLMTGLMLLNRMDTVLIVFPATAYVCLRRYTGNKKRLLYILPAGLSPFILWEVFSVVYYGFPFPNTYYAKMQTGFPLSEYLIRGYRYYEYTFLFDTVTLFGIAAGLTAMFYKPADGRFVATGIGLSLYLLYIFYIGGDFMAGRFFALPFFISVFVFPYKGFAFTPVKSVMAGTVFLLCLAIPVVSIHEHNLDPSNLRTPAVCLLPWNDRFNCALDRNGVSNERAFWKKKVRALALWNEPEYLRGFDMDLNNGGPVAFYETAGVIAFTRPRQHVIDFSGVTDALITRMPPIHYKGWKTGHIARLYPKGLKASLLNGKNMIVDREIAAYYDKLKEVVSAPLFSVKRFKAILELNTRKPFPSAEKWETLPTMSVRDMYRFQILSRQNTDNRENFRELASLSDKTSLPDLQKRLKSFDVLMPFIAPVYIDLERKSRASRVLIETETWKNFPCETLTFLFFDTDKDVISGKTVPYLPVMRIDVPEDVAKDGFDKIMMVKPACKTNHRGFFTDAFLFKRFELAE